MNAPVNSIRIERRGEKAHSGREWCIEIDRSDLLRILDPANSWPEKKQIRLNVEALKASIEKSGDYPILICGHCAESNFISPEDVGLEPVRVNISDDLVSWRIQFTEASGRGEQKYDFTFHRPQYERVVAGVLAEGY